MDLPPSETGRRYAVTLRVYTAPSEAHHLLGDLRNFVEGVWPRHGVLLNGSIALEPDEDD